MLSFSNPSSYKDPDGSVIFRNGTIYRLIYSSYKGHFDNLINTGLYEELRVSGMLVEHKEASIEEISAGEIKSIYKVLKPELITFVSYPYEWSFSQLKSAALLTLEIQLKALEKNMWLKDANCYNVQFKGIEPVFIDTSSFENYTENAPWPAYGQFCRHFLGPLLLHEYGMPELCDLALSNPEGIPLKIISYSLPRKTRLNLFIYLHIHYHAKLETKFKGDSSFKKKKLALSKNRLIALILHLKSGIEKLEIKKGASEWSDYYENFSYNDENFIQKKNAVVSFIESVKPSRLLDMGCNEGEFSLLCSEKVNYIVAADSDAVVINNLAVKLKQKQIKNILPLVINISHPSPGIGLLNKERSSFNERACFDGILALALVHHLAIGSNIPFELMAKQFAAMSSHLLIEFVPKDDSQAQKLLITKKDIYETYTLENFLKGFSLFYEVKDQFKLSNSNRILFRMQAYA